MSTIDFFAADNLHGKSPWMKKTFLSLIRFVSLDQISKINYAILLQVNILR